MSPLDVDLAVSFSGAVMNVKLVTLRIAFVLGWCFQIFNYSGPRI